MKKYLIQCKYCGAILLKTENPLVGLLTSEIKCPNPKCRKLLKIPEDIITTLEHRKRGRG